MAGVLFCFVFLQLSTIDAAPLAENVGRTGSLPKISK